MYEYKVEEIKSNRLKLAKDTKTVMDDYEEVFQIGATVEMNLSSEDLFDRTWVVGKISHYRLLIYLNHTVAKRTIF